MNFTYQAPRATKFQFFPKNDSTPITRYRKATNAGMAMFWCLRIAATIDKAKAIAQSVKLSWKMAKWETSGMRLSCISGLAWCAWTGWYCARRRGGQACKKGRFYVHKSAWLNTGGLLYLTICPLKFFYFRAFPAKV